MKNRGILIFILLFTATIGYSQKNSIYLELFGNGVLGSVNYERQLTQEHRFFMRVGIGFYSNLGILGDSKSYYTIPLSFNYLVDIKNNNYLDLGIGATLVQSNLEGVDAPNAILYLFTNIGFRRNFGNNLFWRIHASPFVTNLTKDYYEVTGTTFVSREEFDFPKAWFGFSFGKRF